MHKEVIQRFGEGWIETDVLQFLEGQKTLAVVREAGGSLTFSKVLFALKASSVLRNLASSYCGGKSERDQADAIFEVGTGGVIMRIHYIYNHSTYSYDRAYQLDILILAVEEV